MSEENDVQQSVPSPVHPAVTMALILATRLHADPASTITKAQFEERFNSVAASEDWRDCGINLRTAALMVATALHLQATLSSSAAPSSGASPSDPAAAALAHAGRTMEVVKALSALADQFGGGTRT